MENLENYSAKYTITSFAIWCAMYKETGLYEMP